MTTLAVLVVFLTSCSSTKALFETGEVAGTPSETAGMDSNKNLTRLRVVTLLDPPFVMLKDGGSTFSGMVIDILHEAAKGIGDTSVDIKLISDNRFGWEERPGVWNGLVGALQNKTADLAAAALTASARRSQVIHLSPPFMIGGFRVLYKIPDSWNPQENTVTLLKPFSPGLWVLIVFMFLLTSCSLYAIGRFSPYEDVAFVGRTATYDGLTLPNSLLYTFSTLLWQGYTSAPKSISGRILTSVWWVFAVLTVGAYIAGLCVTLFKVSPEIRTLPFSTVDEMSRQSKVGIMVVGKSSAYRYLENSSGRVERRIFARLQADPSELVMKSTGEALEKMTKSDGKFALLMDGPAAEYLATQEPCDKMVIGEVLGHHGYVFACRNDSGLCNRMDTQILRMQEDDRIQSIKNKYFHEGCKLDKPEAYVYEGLPFFDTFGGEPDAIMPRTITIKRFSAAFILLVIGFLLSGLFLGAEILYAKRKGTAMPRKLERVGRDDDSERIDRDFHDEQA
ncbi:glutamate receptor ionotropic, kainate 3 [Aplysia californica]|uniref:Glutamate receptor ionotropic, kainate 3 n=1 Tax=Aplysia californica TaxID=6500 RepID=A0ABM0JUW5_APLCA|nr:glutamate receptor ionotropic, kainate 3 [Aplysia californica]